MIAVLNDIRSIHNVGSIFRTADGAGVEKIYLCGITPKPVDELGRSRTAFTKVSLGAEKNVPWEHVPSCTRLISRLKKQGFYIIALEQDPRSILLFDFKLSRKSLAKTTLIVGHEREGISPTILKYADMIIEIPMHGKKESLNVSVAFGIAAYCLKRCG